MKKLKDQYDLSQHARTKTIGFDSFQDGDTKLYYFHFNNGQKKPLLFSQGYKTKKGRDNGIQSVRQNMTNEENIQRTKTGDKHFFLVKAANNQEVAHSRSFPSFKKMENSIEEIIHILHPEKGREKNRIVVNTEKPKKKKKQKRGMSKSSDIKKRQIAHMESIHKIGEEQKPSTSALAKNLTTEHSPTSDVILTSAKELATSKSAFRIDFYKSEDQGTYHGRIVHFLSKDRKNFEGLDSATIIHFIEKHLNPSLTNNTIKNSKNTNTSSNHHKAPLNQPMPLNNQSLIELNEQLRLQNLNMPAKQYSSDPQTQEQHLASHGILTPEKKKEDDNVSQESSADRDTEKIQAMMGTAPVKDGTIKKKKSKIVTQEEHLSFYGLAPIVATIENKKEVLPPENSMAPSDENIPVPVVSAILKKKLISKSSFPVCTQEEHLAMHNQLEVIQAAQKKYLETIS